MAYDERLAQRIRSALQGHPHITEKKMFGGVAFLRKGLMFVGVSDASLMARVGKDNHADSLGRKHVRPMDFTGRPLRGIIYVASDALTSSRALARWLDQATAFAESLPAKSSRKNARRTRRIKGAPE